MQNSCGRPKAAVKTPVFNYLRTLKIAVKMTTAVKKIQMVDLIGQYQKIQKEIDEAVINVIRSSAYINGPEVKSFKAEAISWGKTRDPVCKRNRCAADCDDGAGTETGR